MTAQFICASLIIILWITSAVVTIRFCIKNNDILTALDVIKAVLIGWLLFPILLIEWLDAVILWREEE